MFLTCDMCNGDGFVSFGDRHVENVKEVCPKCKGNMGIEARTGEVPEASASPDGTELYAGMLSYDDRVKATIRAPKIKLEDKLEANLRFGSFGASKPTRLMQLYKHDPDKGIYGDCQRTCLAMMLGFSTPEYVPHFGSDGPPDGVFWDRVAAWLGEMGYKIFQTLFDGSVTLTDVMRTQGISNPGIYYMLVGKSPRGIDHVVVCLGDAVWCDPHPEGGDIVEPGSDGFYRIEVLVPTSMTTFQRPRGHEDLPETPGPV